MPSTIFLVLSTWDSGMLNVNGKFHLSSFSILLYNAVFLLVSVVVSFWIGPIAYGVGALISAIMMVGFLISGYKKLEKFPVGISFKQTERRKNFGNLRFQLYLAGQPSNFMHLFNVYFLQHFRTGLFPQLIMRRSLLNFHKLY